MAKQIRITKQIKSTKPDPRGDGTNPTNPVTGKPMKN
jgi:hypothetical protein